MSRHERACELALHRRVALPTVGVLAKPVAQVEVVDDLLRASLVHVDVDVTRRCSEHPVIGLTDPQRVPLRLERRAEGLVVLHVVDHQADVDDRLGGQARHRRRPDVMDVERGIPEGRRDPRPLDLEACGPRRVVVDDRDRGDRLEAADQHPLRVVLPTHAAS